MKWIYPMLFLTMICNLGCGLRERELRLEKKENEINQKEQQLLLMEKQLQLREAALAEREKVKDSLPPQVVPADSTAVDSTILGNWATNMRCTETTCEGSAVGDTKNELWTIEYESNAVIVKAMADKKLVRVYTGAYSENGLQLTAEQEPEAPSNKIIVRLEQKNPNEMEGIREISRADECHIVYAVTLKKI